MTTGRNGAGPWIEFPMATTNGDEMVRITLITNPTWREVGGFIGPAIRVQKRNAKGNLLMGPEFPATQALEFIAAFSALANGPWK